MDPITIANQYYDAWRGRAGDMTGVPLADDFAFTGPMASFREAAGFRAMARQAGAAVRSFRIRHQFADGDLVCSIIDWEMAMLPGVLTAAEVLQVRDGTIVRGELIYDAEELRRAMAAPSVAVLLERSFQLVADVLAQVDDAGWAARSACTAWTVRQAGNHLVGSVDALTRMAEGEHLDQTDTDPHRLADTDHLGADASKSLRRVAERTVAVFSRPEVLDGRYQQPVPDASGMLIANVCLLESLVHGWDVAYGAGLVYRPDDAVVATVRAFTDAAIGDEQRAAGAFAAAQPVGPDAGAFAAVLGHLGRRPA